MAVTKSNIKQYLGNPDFPTKKDICTGQFAADCTKAGL